MTIMTKEDAIKCLETIEVLVFRDVTQTYFHEDVNAAITIAIDAMKGGDDEENKIMSNGFVPMPSDEILERLTEEDVNAIIICGRKFVLIDCVLEIIDKFNHNGSISVKLLQKELKALKGEENGTRE